MLLTMRQTAEHLGKSVRQVRYLIQTQRLPARKVGGRWRIDSDDLPESAGQAAARERKRARLHDVVVETLELRPEDAGGRFSIVDIKAFALALPVYRQVAHALELQHPACLALERALEHLARGCHRFRRDEKTESYRAARDAVSTAVCHLHIDGADELTQLASTLEREVMPAIAGLLRRLDGRRRR